MLPWLLLSHTIKSRTRVWENEKFLYASVWLKEGNRLTGYVFTHSPAGCTILLFIFFIESGLEGKNSCSYAPGRDLLWGWWVEERERRGGNDCLRATGGFKFRRLYPGAFDSLLSLSLSLTRTLSLSFSSPATPLLQTTPPLFRSTVTGRREGGSEGSASRGLNGDDSQPLILTAR